MSNSDEIWRMRDLYDSGQLSREEFEKNLYSRKTIKNSLKNINELYKDYMRDFENTVDEVRKKRSIQVKNFQDMYDNGLLSRGEFEDELYIIGNRISKNLEESKRVVNEFKNFLIENDIRLSFEDFRTLTLLNENGKLVFSKEQQELLSLNKETLGQDFEVFLNLNETKQTSFNYEQMKFLIDNRLDLSKEEWKELTTLDKNDNCKFSVEEMKTFVEENSKDKKIELTD